MENEVNKYKQRLRKLEAELELEELSEKAILGRIEKYRSMSMILSEKIQSITWKISKANFIQSYEEEKRCLYLSKIERSAAFMRKAKSSEIVKRSSPELLELRKNVSEKLELLEKNNSKKAKLIFSCEQELYDLKKQNNNLMQRLLTDLREGENEEKRLADILDEIETEEEDIDFEMN